ncbi:RNA polymerase II elongation factor [Agyrium rufum]|nr:RNA polymerase II elongation factor [Agyrium rufum]
MDVKDIQEKSKALQKATAENEAPSVILGILNDLSTGIVATEDLLRKTKIGITVNRSKSHSNPEIARRASELVHKWRVDIKKQNASNGGTSTSVTSNGDKLSKTSTPDTKTASPAPSQQKKESQAKPPSVPPELRSWKKDKISTTVTHQAKRDSCIGLLYDGLCPGSTHPAKHILTIASQVEASTMRHHGPESQSSYKEKVSSLYQNLRNKANPNLKTRVLDGDVSPERLVTMSHEELKSKEMRETDKVLEKENMRAAQVAVPEKSVSSTFTCGKCKKQKVSYSQAQTRSADEPMTTFCECLFCGHRWKFS